MGVGDAGGEGGEEERMEGKTTDIGGTRPREERAEEKEGVGAAVEVEGQVVGAVHEYE